MAISIEIQWRILVCIVILLPLTFLTINCGFQNKDATDYRATDNTKPDLTADKALTDVIEIGHMTVGGDIGDLAPEFSGITNWINSSPLTLQELRGNVVLIDIWTYTCVNCIRTIPYIKEWYSRYQDQGLVIIGIHAPEFEFEKLTANVERSMIDLDISWPVAQDNDMKTWDSYGNMYWPAKYVLDKNGVVKYRHFGEGSYAETENAIRILLEDYGPNKIDYDNPLPVDQKVDLSFKQSVLPKVTPELYFGRRRNAGILLSGGTPYIVQEEYYLDQEQPVVLIVPDVLSSDKIYLNGEWQIEEENVTHSRDSTDSSDFVAIKYSSKTVNVVMSSSTPTLQKIWVTVNGDWLTDQNKGDDVLLESTGESYLWIDKPQMYKVINHGKYKKDMTLNLATDSMGSQFYAFTFGVYEEGP